MTQKKRWGDRRDAVRIRDIDGVHAFMAHLMPNRTQAEVYLHYEVDVTDLVAYIKAKNEVQGQKITVFHGVVYAVTRLINERPLLNRYISGKRYYQRRWISLSFVAKKKFSDKAEEALMVIKAKGSDTLADFTTKIVGDVHKARAVEEEHGVDGVLNTLKKLPKWMVAMVMWAFRLLDRHGWMPDSITDDDPNCSTVLLSNLGSIGCDAVYHHLNDYGTNSIVITVGKMIDRQVFDDGGNVRVRTMLPLGITVDERIADGFYFARSMKLMDHLFANPALMEKPIEEELSYAY